jgi:hypothetical protein
MYVESMQDQGATLAASAVTDVTGAVAMKRCKCCELDHPLTTHFRSRPPQPKKNERKPVILTYCRACEAGAPGGGQPQSRKKRGDVTLEWCQQNAIDWFARRDLGLPTRSIEQLDISVEAHKIGADPGGMRRRVAEEISPEEVAARRQARFEAAEAAPVTLVTGETRQVRRQRERRLVKDARLAFTRPLTDAEVTALAIDRSMGARSRAKGGTVTVRRRRKRVAWKLEPNEAEAMLKAQGYRCALTGEAFQESTEYGSTNPFGPSPNRINPGGDYTADNCEFVAWWVNRLIGDMPRSKALQFLAERKLLRKDVGQISLI